MTLELPTGPNVDWSQALAAIKAARVERQSGKKIPAPCTLEEDQWPPDYDSVYAWRQTQLAKFEKDPDLLESAKEWYKKNPAAFINHWCDVYEPRNAGTDKPTWMPFIMFRKQEELINFIEDCIKDQQPGLVEKSRTMGATWICVSWSIHRWLFWPGSVIGWGSQNAQSVDRLGDPKSIFEKLRMSIRRIPSVFQPSALGHEELKQYVCKNVDNGSSIVGEVGNNIGRGGRALIYFKDEAQPLDSKLLTPTGWIQMGDVVVGDLVVGLDGSPRRVTNINDCGVHEVYKVIFSDGTSARCSKNHLWSVDCVYSKRRRLTLSTIEILKSLKYTSPGGQTLYRYRLPVHGPVNFDSKDLVLHPYIVGALLGDGSISDVGGTPRITTKDSEIIDNMRMCLPDSCVMNATADPLVWSICDSEGRRGQGKESRARMLVVDSGIAGCRSWEKSIPDTYLFSSYDDRISLLQGLMDTDGSATCGGYGGGSPTFHTTSKLMAEQVRFLVQSLGGTATFLKTVDSRGGYRDNYTLHLALPEGIIPFRVTRKIQQLKKRKHPIGRTIVSVESCGLEEVRCITVDSDDGLYLTDHCIVTHNSAHYAQPEKIEASLSETTNVPIDISSVNGIGNLFHRRREGGIDWTPGEEIPKGYVRVLVMDWSDHPEYNLDWYNQKRSMAKRQGTAHIFAQEIERNYAASVEGVIIQSEWVEAAIDAHKLLGIGDEGEWLAALDVADGGIDANAFVARKGIILRKADSWAERDTGRTARRSIGLCAPLAPIDLDYDCIGIGAGIKSEVNRLNDEDKMPKGVSIVPWSASHAALKPYDNLIPGDPESPLNKDTFENIKAQGWWQLARRFELTYRAVMKFKGTPVEGDEDLTWDPADLVSIDSKIKELNQIKKELCQAVMTKSGRLRMMVDKTPDGAKSPNYGDSVMMCYWPMPKPVIDSGFVGPIPVSA